ncbi:Prolipoprotein diacylglyceryl transferase [Pedobacter sp. Bi27]|uniref:prolipoprotein diacylglyceryl transferase n=1 Tax=unclassified Pedobacter TaxID=2628915 RepID=UPI001D4B7739|nr:MULTISPECIES: prolipoprotein diacylglyceryl transferase family protein [unclassified Pedobacter]CAH0159081.1 Prolipoprotein diacylglyceryl transferase [Pedobacter sp. Bi126]CAH0159562.1 Prolipoprotein diacylglyceryl transferase [Pedobacter sp. Bi27]CAH0278657.1 Prolipoprotein diacylglyceryl transferase [Pedobacter sp. Bi36]
MLLKSLFPFQFEFFGNLYHYHYIFETLAFIIGVRLYYFYKKGIKDPISDENRLWIMLGAMLGALIGSRVIAVLETPEVLRHLSFSVLYQSKTIVGGLLGGLFGVELMKKIIGVNIASGDVYVIPILVALIIGRIGCFSMGIDEPTYGIPTHFFTGMDLGDGILRHPIMLYEMVYLVLLIFLFNGLKNKTLINGDRFKLFMMLYFLFRFWVEFIKPYHSLFLNLSSIHWSALFIFIYYYRFIIRISKQILHKQ